MLDPTGYPVGAVLYAVIWEHQVVKAVYLRSGGTGYATLGGANHPKIVHEFAIYDPQTGKTLDERSGIDCENLYSTLEEATSVAAEGLWNEARIRSQQAAYFIRKHLELRGMSLEENEHYVRFLTFGSPASAREAIVTGPPAKVAGRK